MSRTIRDAAGQTIRVGDTAGGTANASQSTVIGQVTEISYSRLCLTVIKVTTPGSHAPAVGSPLWLPAHRTFLVHTALPTQTVKAKRGQVTSLRWSGSPEDLSLAAGFTGSDLVGAIDGEGGWTLLLRVNKGRATPDAVPPGWFVLRPPVKGRHRACDPNTYAAAYAAIATDHTRSTTR